LEKRRLLLAFLAALILIAALWYTLKQNEVVAQDFSLTDLNGNVFHLSDFKGKIVVIEFITTWCGYCRQQISYYEDVWSEYVDKIVLIIVDIDPGESEDVLRTFARQFSYSE